MNNYLSKILLFFQNLFELIAKNTNYSIYLLKS
jgi:hypothetical protein